jgi:hypothetical protein
MRTGKLRDGKTRARFLVLATCGKRPCQLMRARPIDLNFKTRIWDVEPAKNSHGGPLWLNDEMLAAWMSFDAADAWGDYDPVSFAKTLRRNGWPAGVRPYNMRHQTLQTMTAAGADFGAVQQAAGHASPETTRRSYVPHEVAVSQRTGALIDGRFDPAVFTASTARRSGLGKSLVDGSAPGLASAATASTAAPGLPRISTKATREQEGQKGENINNFAGRPRLVKRGSGKAELKKMA